MGGYGVYQTAQRTATGPIQMEADIMGRITREIEAYKAKGGPDFVKALYRNVQLWNALSADLLSEDNQLPEQVKASLISLSIFVERHTEKVVAKEATVDALIDVNRSIIAGLFEAHKRQMSTAAAPVPGQFKARSA